LIQRNYLNKKADTMNVRFRYFLTFCAFTGQVVKTRISRPMLLPTLKPLPVAETPPVKHASTRA
jgi:hypothetical protein